MTDSIHYLNELANSNNAVQIISFNDDSTEVQFKDGSSVQLSPCGSCYQYVQNIVGCPVASENNVTRRRCCFATSETKSKVHFSIYWRNHFSQRPYLPNYLHHLYDEKVHLHKDITSYTWPEDLDIKNLESADEIKNISQDLVIHAKEDFAKLNVSKNGFMCEVKSLVKVSPAKNLMKNDKKENTESSPKRNYISLRQIFSSGSSPTFCEYPLSIALQIIQQKSKMIEIEKYPSKQLINACHAPQPLPSTCNKQFSHVWRLNQTKQDIELPTDETVSQSTTSVKLVKAIWNSGVFYWFVKALTGENRIQLEVWLPDGSIIISNTSSNHYFTHFTSDSQDKITFNTKRVYSSTCLPMNSNLKSVVLRAIRLRSYAEQVLTNYRNVSSPRHCWQENILGFGNLVLDSDDCSTNNDLDALQETTFVPGLGKFSALKGSIQIMFENGTTMYITLNQMNLNSLHTSSDTLSEISCRILFSNGQYTECGSLVQSDSHFCGYLNAACDWLLWLAKPKEERQNHHFYSDTIFSSDKIDMVVSELEKINRFNFLVENNSLASIESSDASIENDSNESILHKSSKTDDNSLTSSPPNQFSSCLHDSASQCDVKSALKNTNDAINDIDALIKSLRPS